MFLRTLIVKERLSCPVSKTTYLYNYSSENIYKYYNTELYARDEWRISYIKMDNNPELLTLCMENDSECTHTLVCDTCISILRYAITCPPPHWNGVGVCVSWSILGRCTGHPAMYMAAHVRTNPIFIFIFGFLIFEF